MSSSCVNRMEHASVLPESTDAQDGGADRATFVDGERPPEFIIPRELPLRPQPTDRRLTTVVPDWRFQLTADSGSVFLFQGYYPENFGLESNVKYYWFDEPYWVSISSDSDDCYVYIQMPPEDVMAVPTRTLALVMKIDQPGYVSVPTPCSGGTMAMWAAGK